MIWLLAALFAIAVLALDTRSLALPKMSVPPRRRWLTTLLLATSTLVPVAPLTVLPSTLGRGAVHAVAADDRLLSTIETSGVVLAVALLAWWHVLVQALVFVRPPQRWQPSPTLVATNDATLLQRIHTMTSHLGLREPVVLEQRARHGPAIAAWAIDGLVPTIVLDQGLLLRLRAPERDAIIAHELGHLARHWATRLMGITTGIALGIVAASTVAPWPVTAALALAAMVSLRNLVRQHEEFAADRLGATLVGGEVMARALHKVHAVNFQSGSRPWQYALSTHPHLLERAARLGVGCEPTRVRRCTFWRLFGIVGAVLTLAASLALGVTGEHAAAIVLALALAVTPQLLRLTMLPWRQLRDRRPLVISLLSPIARAKSLLAAASLAMLLLARVFGGETGDAMLMCALVLILVMLSWGNNELRARIRLRQLAAGHDWPKWCQTYEALPASMQKRPDLWLLASNVDWLLGEHQRADDRLETLLDRWPLYHMARMTLIDRRQLDAPAEALNIARELHATLPTNPLAELALAGALRRVGDNDAAWSAMQHVLQQRPDMGIAHAMACRIHIGRGDLAAARAALAEAERLDPGELRVVLAEAELALAEHTVDAEQLAAAVRERAAREPFALLDAEFLLPAP